MEDKKRSVKFRDPGVYTASPERGDGRERAEFKQVYSDLALLVGKRVLERLQEGGEIDVKGLKDCVSSGPIRG